MTDRFAGLDLAWAKRLLPQAAKDVAEETLRLGGMVTASLRPVPDFFVIGTKRGGTTAIWQHLLAHPQVMPMVPAAKNLKSPEWFFRHQDRSLAWYLGHFPTEAARRAHARHHGGAAACGEASPMYLYDPRVPARVAAVAPRARIVVLLRDPVARAWSQYRERCKEGVERLSFADALAAEPGRVAGEEERMAREPAYWSRAWDWYSYRQRGIYLPQLQRWWQHFDPDQVLVVRSEDFYADPARVLARVDAHIGLTGRGEAGVVRSNHAPTPKRAGARPDPGVMADLEDFYAPHQLALEAALRAAER